MRFQVTPLRQIERVYAAILTTASRLDGIVASIGLTRDTLAERIAGISAEVQELRSGLAPVANGAPSDISRAEIDRRLDELRKGLASITPGNPVAQGWQSYSQCDEDGIIRECLRRIGEATPLSRTFIEVGCADGMENNTHQLVLDGFAGCWIDGDPAKIRFIEGELGTLRTQALLVRQAFVTLDTIEDVMRDCRAFLGTGDVDFFSFDIDGNDTHLVRRSLAIVRPKLICVEYNAKFPPPTRIEMRYATDHRWSGDDYFSASLQSWVDLLEGYVLVSCNLSGANAFFVRQDLAQAFASHPITALYQPARYWLVGANGHRPSLRWLRQAVQESRAIERPWLIEARVPHLPSFEFEIHRRADQFISTDLARNKVWEPVETEVFRRICRRGDFLVDIGANIGWYAVVGSKLIGPEGRLLCFEPDPRNRELLNRNVARSTQAPRTEVRAEAIGDLSGTVRLFLSDTNLGDHRLFDDGSARDSIEVPITTLDTVLAHEPRLPDLVKSDTQGSEAKILAGARGLLAKGWRPLLLLEFWPFGLAGSGSEPMALWNAIAQLDYSVYEVTEGSPKLTKLTREQVHSRISMDISPSSGRFINLLAIPTGSDRQESIADMIAP